MIQLQSDSQLQVVELDYASLKNVCIEAAIADYKRAMRERNE